MIIWDWIVIFLAYNFIMAIGLLIVSHTVHTGGALEHAPGWSFVNPWVIYHYNHVNWFGAFMVALWYTLLCPIGAVAYWFYRCCTVGRE